MQNTSKIAVLGGTGKSGTYLIQQLLNAGYHFRLLVRNLEKFKIESPQIEIIHGDANDYDTVASLVKGCDAVISTLGIGIPHSAPNIFSTASRNIIQAGIKRYIVITGLHVDTPMDKKSPKVKFGTDWMYQNYPKTTADRQLEYKLLLESKLAWTLVRLPLITLTDLQKKVVISLEDCLGDDISATDLANFLIAQLDDETYLRKAPFIANI